MKPDPPRPVLGGVIHTYQKYDPQRFPSPTQPPPDLVSPAFEQWLVYGSRRRLTEEELARAIRLDPSQIQGLGPSLDSLMALLLERKRKILATYETDSVLDQAAQHFAHARRSTRRASLPAEAVRAGGQNGSVVPVGTAVVRRRR